VKWVLFAMINAEELGITSKNVDEMMKSTNPEVKRFVGTDGSYGEQLGLSEAVCDGIAASYERWDGRGWPGALSGAEIPIASRIASLAEYAEVAHRMGGAAGVVAFDGERPFAVLAFTVVADRAVAIDVFNEPELVAKLDIRGITARGV